MVCSRGESLTTHTNQMKLFKTIAAAAVVGASLVNTAPAMSSVVFDLHRGEATEINDGNPHMYVVRGCRTSKSHRPRQTLAYPIEGERPGAKRTKSMSQSLHQQAVHLFEEDDKDGFTYRNSIC